VPGTRKKPWAVLLFYWEPASVPVIRQSAGSVQNLSMNRTNRASTPGGIPSANPESRIPNPDKMLYK
jgi:hypothetical protein